MILQFLTIWGVLAKRWRARSGASRAQPGKGSAKRATVSFGEVSSAKVIFLCTKEGKRSRFGSRQSLRHILQSAFREMKFKFSIMYKYR